MGTLALVCWTSGVAVGVAGAASGTGVTAAGAFPSNEDLRHVRSLSDPRMSPDGKRVLVQIADATVDGGRSHLWLVEVAGGAARQLTFSSGGDKRGEHNGRWLGDGSILFMAKRGERTQLYRLPMSGGEASLYDLKLVPTVDESSLPDAVPPRKAGDAAVKRDALAVDVDSFEPAPNGRRIAVIASDPETSGEKSQKDDKADAEWVDHDLHGKRLFLLDADSSTLTPAAVPADVASVVWSQQSDRLIATADAPNHGQDLGPATTAWLVAASDAAHPTELKSVARTVEAGSWSQDGTRWYFLAQSAQDAPPGYPDLYVLTLADGSVRNLTPGFEGSLLGDRPIALGGDVLQAAELGLTRGYIRIHGDRVQSLHFDAALVSRLNGDASQSAWVWLGQSSAQPSTLYYAKQPGGTARVLSTPALLPGNWPVPSQRVVRWTNEGMALEGLLYLPPQSEGGKVPLIVDVHGGPTGAWADSFNALTQYLLGQGWAIFRPNPRGSTGRGAAFAAANKNDLGGADYRDIMSGTDAVIAQYPIDAQRLALMGYSYGGEMAGFVEGKTDRFKAVVSGAPVIDQHSEYGTEADSWYDRWFYGKPWEHAQDAWRQSPLSLAAKAKSPFLLIQGEADSTDPLGQSVEMYRALRQAGVAVQLVQYPREDHSPLAQGMFGMPSTEPWHGFDARQRLVKFIQAGFEPPAAGGR